VRYAPAALFMLLTEPPANPVCGVPVDESVSRCNRAEFEVISPPANVALRFNQFFRTFGADKKAEVSCYQ
jgi:hypothetical protein